MGACCSRPSPAETTADKGTADGVGSRPRRLDGAPNGPGIGEEGLAVEVVASVAPSRCAVVAIPVVEFLDDDAVATLSGVGPAARGPAASSPMSYQGTIGNTTDISSADGRSRCSLVAAPSQLDEELARSQAARKDIEHAVLVATAAVHLRSVERTQETTDRHQAVSSMLPPDARGNSSTKIRGAAQELSPQQAKEVLQVLGVHVEKFAARRNKMDQALGQFEVEVQNVKLFEKFV